MTPANAQALIEKWRERAREQVDTAHEAEGKGALVTAAGLHHEAEARQECADELEPVAQALEALRDEMREWGEHVVDGVWVPHGCTPNSKPRQWANRLDVLLHGA